MEERRALLEECLRLNGELTLPSAGMSMWPELREGDELTLTRAGFSELKPGDVVVFASAGALVAHRVLKTYVESGKSMLLVKGDHRHFADPPIFYEQVVGRVAEARRAGKRVYRRRELRDRLAAWRSGAQEQAASFFAERLLGLAEPSAEAKALYGLTREVFGWAEPAEREAALDDEALYALGAQARLTPLLTGAKGLPAALAERCSRDLREEQGRQLLLYAELERLMRAFEAAGVRLMVIKGPAVADGWYARSAWRPMVDLDLVVAGPDWAQALTLLESCGFTPECSNWSRLTESLTGQAALLKPMGPFVVAVELHRDLAILSERLSGAEVAMARAWERARPYRVGAATALTLAPEEALSYACTHWAQHHCFGSIWLVDIALMASSAAIDWEQLRAGAAKDGTRAHLFAAMFLARHLLGAPVPEAALSAMAPDALKSALIRHLAWRKATEGCVERPDARSFALQLLLLPGWGASLRGLARGVWPSADWLRQHYGAAPEAGALGLRLAHWRKLLRLGR